MPARLGQNWLKNLTLSGLQNFDIDANIYIYIYYQIDKVASITSGYTFINIYINNDSLVSPSNLRYT